MSLRECPKCRAEVRHEAFDLHLRTCDGAIDVPAAEDGEFLAAIFSSPRPTEGPYRVEPFESGWRVVYGDDPAEPVDLSFRNDAEDAEILADQLNAAWRRGMEDA